MPVRIGAAMSCTFCGRPAGAKWTLTACNGDPDDVESWRREVLPVCPRCCRALDKAGSEGVKLKRTGERWYGGDTVGSSWLLSDTPVRSSEPFSLSSGNRYQNRGYQQDTNPERGMNV